MAAYLNDSAAEALTLSQRVARLWRHRELTRLLVVRDLRLRYKRSALGVWWTVLGPLLEMATLAVVFSQVFRFSTRHAPYLVYLLSGIVVAGLMRNVILRTANSIAENAHTLSRIRVPAEVFSLSAALEVATTFLVSLVPLALIMLISGGSISPTAPLLLIPAGILVAFSFGVGLALAPAVARFNDTTVLTGILLGFVTYLAPVFYPFSIIPQHYRLIVELNPLYHFLNIFRSTLYGDQLGAVSDYLIVGGCTAVALVAGGWIFGRWSQGAIALL